MGDDDLREEIKIIRIGNTEFHIAAKYIGTVELQHLIKRLIQKEMEQEYC